MIAQLITDRLNEKRLEFRKFWESGDNWIGDWTKLLKRTIADLGYELGEGNQMPFSNIGIAANGIDNDNDGEYLYDLAWFEMYPEVIEGNHYMKSIPMVLESEISDMRLGGFKVDFDKLLVANSLTKIMVTRNLMKPKNNEDLSQKLEYAKTAVKLMNSIEVIHVIYWDENTLLNSENEHFYLRTFVK